MTLLEARLKARRDWLTRVLARKPITKIGEMRRKALVQRLQNSVEVRGNWSTAYRNHFQAIEEIVKSSTAPEAGSEDTSSPAATTKGSMEDF
jgi:hypothetical protein